MTRERLTYLALAVITIAVGLIVHGSMTGMSPAVRDITGDALWATMMVWWIGVLVPARSSLTRGVIAYAISTAVELSQLYHAPVIDAVRETRIGQLVLGTGFDPRDLLSYAAGVAVAVLIDVLVVARFVRRRREL